MKALRSTLVAVSLFCAVPGLTPAHAEVVQSSAQGFVTEGKAVSAASKEDIWYFLIEPAGWWSAEHTWSGDSQNLRLDAEAGGCFCEDLPEGGSVEHARVIYAAPGERLRLSGALGPLQGEAVVGTLNIELSDVPGGTEIRWTYVVGGNARISLNEIAGGIDLVLNEQFNRLASQTDEAQAAR